MLRLEAGCKAEPSAAVLDSRMLRSTPESGEQAGNDGAERNQGSKLHMAVDTPGYLLTLHVTPAKADDRAPVEHLAKAVQAATDDSVEIAFADQGYAGDKPATAARRQGIELEVVKLTEAKRGFVLLPRRRIVERSFAWVTGLHRLVKDHERYPSHWPTYTSSTSAASCSKGRSTRRHFITASKFHTNIKPEAQIQDMISAQSSSLVRCSGLQDRYD